MWDPCRPLSLLTEDSDTQTHVGTLTAARWTDSTNWTTQSSFSTTSTGHVLHLTCRWWPGVTCTPNKTRKTEIRLQQWLAKFLFRFLGLACDTFECFKGAIHSAWQSYEVWRFSWLWKSFVKSDKNDSSDITWVTSVWAPHIFNRKSALLTGCTGLK